MDDGEPSAKRAILIAGPTASGKSALALALAEDLGGVVINADSMQVYADLRILTARPSDEDMARAPHRLFGHVDAAETYSVARWLTEVDAALASTWSEGRVPVLVGGRGSTSRLSRKAFRPSLPFPTRSAPVCGPKEPC